MTQLQLFWLPLSESDCEEEFSIGQENKQQSKCEHGGCRSMTGERKMNTINQWRFMVSLEKLRSEKQSASSQQQGLIETIWILRHRYKQDFHF